MRIIAVSDLHSRFSFLEKLLNREKADVIAVCGDITDFSREDALKFSDVLGGFDGVALLVHGNCDFPEPFSRISAEDVRFIHGSSFEMNGVRFHGAGGSTFTPFNTPSEYPESYYQKILEKFDYGRLNVLVSHCPPHGILDLTHSGKRAGSIAIKAALDRFRLILCGHVHESRGIEMHGNTVIINPGPLSGGYYAVINMDIPEKAVLKKLK